MDIATIGMYTGAIVAAIIVILVLVMMIEKFRKKNRNITEVVEFKPVDVEKHFKGIKDRESAKKEQLKKGY